MDLAQRLRDAARDHLQAVDTAMVQLEAPLLRAGRLLADCLAGGGKVLACGNGGSAADAQHFAAELVNRYERERPGLAAVALTTDSSALTSIANDGHFDRVYARQVQALGRAGDLLIAITTSGHSANILAALDAARARDMGCIALTGRDGGAVPARLGEGDVHLCVAGTSTARIQEVHILLLHCLCDLIDCQLVPDP